MTASSALPATTPVPAWRWRLSRAVTSGSPVREVTRIHDVPGPVGGLRRLRPVATTGPEQGPGGAPTGIDTYLGVRGPRSFADVLCSQEGPGGLAVAATDVVGLLADPHLARPVERFDQPSALGEPSTTQLGLAHLSSCDGPGYEVERLRSALADPAARCPVPPSRTVGLGRVVPAADAADGLDMLEPLHRTGRPEEKEADAARVLAELWLTSVLFTSARKPSAVQITHVYHALADKLVPSLLRPARARTLVPLMIVDHARRLEVARGADARACALELSIAASRLDDRAPGEDRTDEIPDEKDEAPR